MINTLSNLRLLNGDLTLSSKALTSPSSSGSPFMSNRYLYESTKGQNNEKTVNSIKENVKNQFCPKILWSGVLDAPKPNTYFEVHEKYGPSLNSVFERMKKAPRERELLHLLY